jgi:hypothetical protein
MALDPAVDAAIGQRRRADRSHDDGGFPPTRLLALTGKRSRAEQLQ